MTENNGNSKNALRISVVADFAMICAMISLVFWVGRQAERIDKMTNTVDGQTVKISDLNDKVTTVSGQMLQMTTSSNMATAVERISVLEQKSKSNDDTLTDFRSETRKSLERIENKIDRR